MVSLVKIATAAASVLTFSLAALDGAAAVEILIPSTGRATVQNNAGDLRALENRIQRQQFQQQQQRDREADRLAIPLQRQGPQVQVIRPGCQVQVYGSNGISRGCR